MDLTRIKKEIAGGNLEKSIEMLISFFQYSGLEEENELYSQSSRLQRILKSKRMGVISEESATIVINQITAGLLELLSKIESDLDDSVLLSEIPEAAVKRIEIEIVSEDIINSNSDVIAIKYAQENYGATLHLLDYINREEKINQIRSLSEGMFKVYDVKSIRSKLFLLGTSNLSLFSYSNITNFTQKSLELISDKLEKVKSVAFTIHGVGYGLDEYEAFKAQMLGFNYYLRNSGDNKTIEKIYIYEIDKDRARRIRSYLERVITLFGGNRSKKGVWSFELLMHRDDILKYKGFSSSYPNSGWGWVNSSIPKDEAIPKQDKLLVSIPFEERFDILYYKAIQKACHDNEILCERINSKISDNNSVERFKSVLDDSSLFIVDYTNNGTLGFSAYW